MIIRLSKIVMVMAIAFFATLVVFGNVTDYGTNFAFVHHVFEMDTVDANATIQYRSISSPFIQHAGYIGIIILETLTALFCWVGAFVLLKNIKASGKVFNQKKNIAIIGLTIGFVVWQVAFMSVGGEWFGMWMSEWNGVPDAYRFFTTILLVLIYLIQKESDLDEA